MVKTLEKNYLYKDRSSPSQILFKISFLNNFASYIRKHLCWSLFNKFGGLQACNFVKRRLQHRCFPVKFAKFLRTPFFTEHLRWLLPEQKLSIGIKSIKIIKIKKHMEVKLFEDNVAYI